MVFDKRSVRHLLTLFSLVASILAPVAGAQGLSALHGSEKVDPEVLNALALAPRARVIVVFADPAAPAGSLPEAATDPARQALLAAVRDDLLARLPAAGFELRRPYRTLPGFAGEITRGGLVALLQDPRVLHVGHDREVRPLLEESEVVTNVDDFRDLGYTGDGVTVAVLDTGYDTDHTDLSDDLVAEQCFCAVDGGCCPDSSSEQSGSGSAEDDGGHGTHVAGIITSRGTSSPLGIAPDAAIVAVKVLAPDTGLDSDSIAGLDWVLDERPDVDIVNMSLGGGTYVGDCDTFNPLEAAAVNALRARGTLVFAASGNNGSETIMNSPACIANAISVGASYDANIGLKSFAPQCTDSTTAVDQVLCISNSNSKTDLFAPGSAITSTKMGGGNETLHGTSFASPIAAGCAALLLEKAPKTSPDYLEERLEASPSSVTAGSLSFPRVDCYDAGTPCTTPAVLDLNLQSPVSGTQVETACTRIQAGPYEVASSGDVTFQAGEKIVLRNGVSMASGVEFHAVLDALLVPPP